MKNLTVDPTAKRIVILDTSAFVAGFDPCSTSEEQYTVPMVKEEIMENSMASVRFRTALENGKLKIKTPDPAFENQVKTSAIHIGDKFFLSETDQQILALALGFKTQSTRALIITDDYSIQNVANQLGIEFASLATFGIRFRLQWIRYCPACHRKYPADSKSRTCEVCGTQLKRKPVRKTHLNQT